MYLATLRGKVAVPAGVHALSKYWIGLAMPLIIHGITVYTRNAAMSRTSLMRGAYRME